MLEFVLPPLSAAILTVLALFTLLKKPDWVPLDRPNARSLHVNPTPRIGGLAMLMGLLPVLPWASVSRFGLVLWLSLALCALSLADDYLDLRASYRLLAHGLAAATFLALSPDQPLWINLVLWLLLVWMTNLYNFMDGADGLAGGMALFGFGAYGLAASLAGSINMAMVNWAIAAAALGFLLFNFPPARVFMGDAGSIPLGFLAGTLGTLGWQQDIWPAWFPVLVFSPFLVDATVTLMRRGLRGDSLWQAHKSHYYQRFVRLGHSHRQLALMEYGLMATAATSALCVLRHSPGLGTGLMAAWGAVYVLIGVALDVRWRKSQGDHVF
jgi:UDP-N-acetylmuramyl pentapeptide phosphotransferase/UDP-N-acetylglucosamine-1-phosphate transferase